MSAAALHGVTLGHDCRGFLISQDGAEAAHFPASTARQQTWYSTLSAEDKETVDAWLSTWERKDSRFPMIGMDMEAPFGVYVNGERVAEYDAEVEAREHFEMLQQGGPVTWTDRDGKPTRLALTFSAPCIVIQAGIEIAKYGDDWTAADAHYERLVRADRLQRGVKPVHVGGQSGGAL